jgi:hypothetical protein
MDGIAGLELAPGECRIGVEREIEHRERAHRIKREGPDAFHQVSALRWATPINPAHATAI